MKKILFLMFAVSCLTSTVNAQVAITFSTSATDPGAGSELTLSDGDSGSLFIFAENTDESGNDIDGLALDVIGAGTSFLTATDFEIENPGGTRWLLGTSPGTLGTNPDDLLVNDSNAAGFILSDANGIQNGAGAILHGELTFSASGVGITTLELAEGDLDISVEGQAPAFLDFGTAIVNVTPATVPEPSSLVLLGALAGGTFLRRRRLV